MRQSELGEGRAGARGGGALVKEAWLFKSLQTKEAWLCSNSITLGKFMCVLTARALMQYEGFP